MRRPTLAHYGPLPVLALTLCITVVGAFGCRQQAAPTPSTNPTSATGPEAAVDARVEPTRGALPSEKSVKPGINDAWKSDDVAPLIDRLESETREVYTNRVAIADVVAPEAGSVVADVGSGSGFMTQELAARVGANGKVYAVDINPKLLDQVSARMAGTKLTNVETVLTADTEVDLPKHSVELMFICDTYHHFEYPKTVLASIRRALKPGAQLVIVDFERIEGRSEDWILEHVRAGKQEVISELTEAGFEFVTEHELPKLEQNYVLRFRSPAQ